MNVIGFLMKEGFRGLIRAKYASVFSVIIITLSLMMIGMGYVITRDMIFAVENIRSRFDVDIFLKPDADEQEIQRFHETLRSYAEIDRIHYISPDSAALRFQQEFGEDIFNILDENPLPPSFKIQLKPMFRNLFSVEEISTRLSRQSIVDEIKYRKRFLRLLERYQRIGLLALLGLYAVLTLISIIIISNSIKMTIFARRDAITTMKLIGATNAFIRAPFIIEGTLQGIIGSALAAFALAALFYVFNHYIHSLLEYQFIVSHKFHMALLLLGCLGGFVGSRRAIRRFLK